ncbi:hypothetical protein [Pseudoalteromonas phage J2-1_QLiu-2017]|nr:hypothetical protein [Pseudoalteromonas phage J2-1_QLiu-2017]
MRIFGTRWFEKVKDGGPDSPVDAYFLCEIKGLFSIAILKFNKGCREEYHTHAFGALTWFIKGSLVEEFWVRPSRWYTRSWLPKFTSRHKLHRVNAKEDSWCFTIRGPWSETWMEWNSKTNTKTLLTHGRKVVKSGPIYDLGDRDEVTK